MKDIETIIKALETFPGGTTILYDSSNNETVTFQDVVDCIQELQIENERLNDMKFTQEHCDLYKENEWLKASLRQTVKDTAKQCNDFIHALICKYNAYIDSKDGAYENMHKEANEFTKEKFGVEVK